MISKPLARQSLFTLFKNYQNSDEGFKERLEEGEIPDATPDDGLQL
jgi:hypothetical protein